MADLFISYSRVDREFVRSLHQPLEQEGRDVWVDLDDIPPSAEWLQEIYAGIEAASSVVFVLSPSLLASKVCRQELEHAAAHGKRLIPVVCHDVDREAVPPELAARNWILWRSEDDASAALQALRRALDTDLEWVRDHTRLLTRAIEWDAERRDDSFVLRGSDLRDAEAWLNRAAPTSDPQPTPLQTQYILASRASTARGQRARLGAVSAGLIIALALAVFAFIQRNDAIDQRNISATAEAKALAQEGIALAQADARATAEATAVGEANARATAQVVAETQRDEAARQARIATARQLAAEAEAAVAAYPQRALLLAVEAVQTTTRAGEPAAPAAEDALRRALGSAGGQGLSGHELTVKTVTISPDGRWLVTVSDLVNTSNGELANGTFRLWDLHASPVTPRVLGGHRFGIRTFAISPDSRWLVTVADARSGGASLWDLQVADPSSAPRSLPVNAEVAGPPSISGDGRWLVLGDDRGTVRVWDLHASDPTGAPRVLDGQLERLQPVGVSPDGRWVVAVRFDGTARLWNLVPGPGRAWWELVVAKDEPLAAATFSPNGRWLLTIGRDRVGDLLLWDLTSAEPTVSHRLERSGPVCVSPDGRWAVAPGSQGTSSLWDLAADDPTAAPRALPGHMGAVETCALDRNGHWLVTVDEGWGGLPRLWDLAAGPDAPSRVLPGYVRTGTIIVAVDPAGRWLATASAEGGGRLWDLTAPDPVASPRPLHGHEGAVTALTMSADGSRLATGSGDATARVWDLAAGTAAEPRLLPVHKGTLALAISPDSRWLAAVEGDSGKASDGVFVLQVWSLSDRILKPAPRPLPSGFRPVTLGFSPDGRWLVAGSDEVSIWDLASGRDDVVAAGSMFGGKDGVVAAVTPDGRWLATMNGRARFWDLTGPYATSALRILHGLGGALTDLALDPRGHWLVTVSREDPQSAEPHEIVRLWDLTAANPATTPLALPDHPGGVRPVELSSDGRWLITITRGFWAAGIANLWDLSVADPVASRRILPTQGEGFVGVTISPDGRWAVTSSSDQVPRAWDLASPEPDRAPRFLRGHEGVPWVIAISPDSRWLMVGGSGVVRVWDLGAIDAAALPRTFRSDQPPLRAVVSSGNGRWLVGGSSAGGQLWDLHLDTLVDLACRVAGRNLDGDEWQQYFAAREYPRTCHDQPLDSSVVRRTIGRAESFIAAGDQQAASGAYSGAAIWAVEIGNPSLGATVCRYGSFAGFAALVMPACDQAVAASASTFGLPAWEARGLARALTNDYRGAADDFIAYVDAARRDGQTEQVFAEHRRWIAELEAGRNPFDPATLKALRTRADETQYPVGSGA